MGTNVCVCMKATGVLVYVEARKSVRKNLTLVYVKLVFMWGGKCFIDFSSVCSRAHNKRRVVKF